MVVIYLLGAWINMVERGNKTRCVHVGKDKEVYSQERDIQEHYDRRHEKKNYRIEKRCSRINDKNYAKTWYKINSLVGGGEKPNQSWEE